MIQLTQTLEGVNMNELETVGSEVLLYKYYEYEVICNTYFVHSTHYAHV